MGHEFLTYQASQSEYEVKTTLTISKPLKALIRFRLQAGKALVEDGYSLHTVFHSHPVSKSNEVENNISLCGKHQEF